MYNSAINIADIMGVVESKFSNPSLGKIKAMVGTSSLDIILKDSPKRLCGLR